MKSDKYIQFHFSDGAGQCAQYFIQDGAGTLQHPNQYTDCYETNLSRNERFILIRLAYSQPPSPVRGKARTMALTELHSSLDRRTDKPSPLTGEGGTAKP